MLATATPTTTPTATTNTERNIHKMFYTHNRTQKILEGKGVKVKRIEKVSILNAKTGEFYNCVHAVYIVKSGARCSTFLSVRDYLKDAVQGRRERAKNYVAKQNADDPSHWVVHTKVVQMLTPGTVPSKGSEGKVRHVVTTPTAVVCDCEDFMTQGDYLQEHPYLWHVVMKQRCICKHSVCAMSALGFSSLKDYLAAWKPGGRLNKLMAKMHCQSRGYSRSMNRPA